MINKLTAAFVFFAEHRSYRSDEDRETRAYCAAAAHEQSFGTFARGAMSPREIRTIR